MENLGLILKLAWAIVRFFFSKKEAKDNEVAQVQKEINAAFKIKDKKIKASRLNSLIEHINTM